METTGKRLHLLLVAGIAAALGLAMLIAAPAEAKKLKKVKPEVLGIHAFDGTEPGVPTGSLRFNCYPQWGQIQTSPGNYDWSALDSYVAQAKAWGYKDILYVFCGTPVWAVGNQNPKFPQKTALAGDARATLPPAKMKTWKKFVKKIAKRYRGDITAFQIGNEITSPDFYQGTAKKMAKMTKTAYKILRKKKYGRPDVISASVQTHDPIKRYYNEVAKPYIRELRKMNWPVTHVSGHFYPAGMAGPDKRMKQINMFLRLLRQNNLPKSKEIWDTESNFAVGQSTAPNSAVSDRTAAIWVARNYLDTWRKGLTRSYWYQWSQDWAPFPGVQTRPGDPATAALNTFGGWVTNAKFKKCKKKGKLVVCKFKKGGKFDIAFTERGKKKYKFRGTQEICPVDGSACTTAKRKYRVDTMPVKIG